MKAHLTGLGDEVGWELVVYDPKDRVEEEDLAGDEGAAELGDEGVGPWCGISAAMGWEDIRVSSIEGRRER